MENKELKVERNTNTKFTNEELGIIGNGVMVTPNLDKAWLFRVNLHKDQYIQAFFKFGTIGIGFAIEEADWNTNLPYLCKTEEIWNHIEVNKKYKQITREKAIEAIKLLQETIINYIKESKGE